MKIPKAILRLSEAFESLPGIGPKSAQRITYYLLHVPQYQLDNFSKFISDLKKNTRICNVCKNVTEEETCIICQDTLRDKMTCLVVETPLDLMAFERSGKYKGLYHVLHGSLNPLENIGPDEIYVNDLLARVKENNFSEVIIATNPDMEGEATAMYLSKEIKKIDDSLKVTRLGMGIPTGADLEYADDITLNQAIEGRRQI